MRTAAGEHRFFDKFGRCYNYLFAAGFEKFQRRFHFGQHTARGEMPLVDVTLGVLDGYSA